MSKPMIVTLPLILLLLDYWPLRRFELASLNSQLSTLRRLLVEKLPFLLAAFLTGLITLRAAHQAGSLPSAAHFPMAAAWPMRPSLMPGTSGRHSGPANWRFIIPFPQPSRLGPWLAPHCCWSGSPSPRFA
jgi:hypothetical protein